MTPLFLDTSYIIALEASDDRHHAAANAAWADLLPSLPPLVTTSFVFDEVVTFFQSRGHHEKAVDIGDRHLSSRSVDLIHVDLDLFREGWRYLSDHADKTYSFTDCISFVVMNRAAVRIALALDRHFVQAGFRVLPDLTKI